MTVVIESPKQGEEVWGIVTVKAVYEGRGFQYGTLEAMGGRVGTAISNPMTFLWRADLKQNMRWHLAVTVRYKSRGKTYIDAAGVDVYVVDEPAPPPPPVVADKKAAERRGELFGGGSEREETGET